MTAKLSSKEYWEKNIRGFGGFYDKKSEETLQGPKLLTYVYKHTVFHAEKIYMKKRFEMVSAYIAQTVRAGMRVADIGCGSGIYTKQMAALGATVYASDFTQSALELTTQALSAEELKRVHLKKADIATSAIERVDVAMAIGVFPYIEDPSVPLGNILPYTDKFLFNFLDSRSWFNALRRNITALDVRGYHYHSLDDMRRILAEKGFEITAVQKLATGLMVESKRKKT